MKYLITHKTDYEYSTPVKVCHNVMMLSPRETATVRCLSHGMTIDPPPQVRSSLIDTFGNRVELFSVEESHDALAITSSSEVEVEFRPWIEGVNTPPWNAVIAAVNDRRDPNWHEAVQFLFDSPRIRRSDIFAAYARQSFGDGVPIVAAAADLTHRINVDFTYDTTATHVNTPSKTAFADRNGVCQDFAHVAVACLRSIGVPARYVSGYLRTFPPPGEARMIGADESHAWFALYCGPELGWVDFDPTNDCFASIGHIPVAWGRDYDDVVPIKGVFLGGGEHTLSVSVDVRPTEEG